MLHATMPSSPVYRSIGPAHLSEAFSLIVNVAAPISVPALPFEETPAVFLIEIIVTLVAVCGLALPRRFLLPFAVAMLEAISKGALVGVPIRPLVLSEALWLAQLVLTNVDISVGKEVRSISMAETCFPLALVPISIEPHVDPIALSLARLPLPYV